MTNYFQIRNRAVGAAADNENRKHHPPPSLPTHLHNVAHTMPLWKRIHPKRWKHQRLVFWIFLSIFVLLFVLQIYSVEFEFSWRTRRKLLKSKLALIQAVPYWIRHPWMALDITIHGFEPMHVEWHPRTRRGRFPSVDERVRLYMFNWYHPPCSDMHIGIGSITDQQKHGPLIYHYIYGGGGSHKDKISTKNHDSSLLQVQVFIQEPTTPFADSSYIELDNNRNLTNCQVFLLDRPVIQKGAAHNTNKYCPDVWDMMDIRDSRDDDDDETPLLAIFGDSISNSFATQFPIPIFVKYRGAAAALSSESTSESNTIRPTTTSITEDNNITEQCLHRPYPSLPTLSFPQSNNFPSPIIWKLNTERHWKPLEMAKTADIPWRLKRNQAIWRGVFTGYLGEPGWSNQERCQGNPRCSFVLKHHNNSAIMDVGFTDLLDVGMDRRVQGVELLRDMKSMEDLLEYKILICLEGNDVSSGLKWQLWSRSVVIMAPATLTSWAMEELLVPWVHYIPMDAQGSNAEEMVQWVLEHDEQAQKIAERATLFMEDMVYHPDASKEERQIKEEMIRRYKAHWTRGDVFEKMIERATLVKNTTKQGKL